MFDWDEANEGHIWDRHHGSPAEAEEAVLDPAALMVGAQDRGERRTGLIGATEDGRLLRVIYTMRGRTIRVVTAREANEWERRLYRIRRK